MNPLITLRRHPVIAGVAAIIASVGIFAGAMHAWGPTDRATFTEQDPAPYITFNSITDNSNYGDERNFAIVKDAASTSADDWKDTMAVEPGKEYLVRIYVHNNAADNLNLVAENTRTSVNLPTNTAKSIEINSFISADNATPAKIWDQVTLTSNQDFNLAYIDGSAEYTNNIFPQGNPLGEDLFTSPGALLGYEKLDGKIPGCFKYSGIVTFKVKPQFAQTTDFTMSKQVRKHSTTTGGWTENYTAQAGEQVDFVVKYKNDSQSTMKDVVIKDTLPTGLTYVPGSTILANGNYPTGKTASDNIVSAAGINIGTYAPGLTAWVRFSAKVADKNALQCGINTLKNVATVETDSGDKTDDATVTIEKTCDTPVDKDIEVCEIATKLTKTIKESELKANPSLYADKDSDTCQEAPAPVMIEVCQLDDKSTVTIDEADFDASKHSKNPDDCKTAPVVADIEVCRLADKQTVTIKETAFDSDTYSKSPDDCEDIPTPTMIEVCRLEDKKTMKIDEKDFDDALYSKDSEDCVDIAKIPETPATPSDKPAAELPETGAVDVMMSIVGVGSLVAATGYAIRSRRAL